MKKYNVILSIFVFYVIINMINFPDLYIRQAFNGISAWAFNVLPSVLPFMFFTKILTSLGSLNSISNIFKRPCRSLYKTHQISSLVFLTSAISGYPVGAKMTADLYNNGVISRSDAFKMTSFCSTSGPMFIIGAVGISMLKNATYGYIIFICHILGALINGLLYRNIKVKEFEKESHENKNTNKSLDLSNLVLDSALSIISVGTIITIFFVIITSLSPVFNLFSPQFASILEGIVEITKGCLDIATSFSDKWSILASTFVISFGGLSTILQSLSMLNTIKMPIYLICFQKLTQAIISSLLALLFIFII